MVYISECGDGDFIVFHDNPPFNEHGVAFNSLLIKTSALAGVQGELFAMTGEGTLSVGLPDKFSGAVFSWLPVYRCNYDPHPNRKTKLSTETKILYALGAVGFLILSYRLFVYNPGKSTGYTTQHY
jgi:hypothetical protein